MLNIELPDIKPEVIAIKLKKAAEVKIKKGHPWVFDESIVKQNKKGKSGDIAVIFDQRNNKFCALGLYDASSPIRIKILHFHTQVKLNAHWFEQTIQNAIDKRKPLLNEGTNSARLIYGENDHLPGFIADQYADVLVVKLYSEIWLPYLKTILPILQKITSTKTMVLRMSRLLQNKKREHGLEDGLILFGSLEDEEVVFKEYGISFYANVVRGHKTGFFLDHRHNRKTVGELAKGKRVLDVFSYAGGFSIHALAGIAKSVHSIDISQKANDMAVKNKTLNKLEGQHTVLTGDAFVLMEKLAREKTLFDLIIIDPPSFAKQKSEVELALKQYKRLAVAGLKLLDKNGILVLASCSSRVSSEIFFQQVEQVLDASGRSYSCMDKTYHDIDHPIEFEEAGYLKCGYYKFT